MKIHDLLLCGGFAGLLIFVGCGKRAAPEGEQANYGSIRDQVVQQVKSGQIKPNQAGVAMLPPDFQSASFNGQVIAGQNAATGWVIVFPLQPGRTAVQSFVYIEKTPPPGGQTLQLGSLAVTLGNKSGEHWYQGTFAGK